MVGHFEAELCQVLIEEHFGKAVALVVSTLLREPGPLSAIKLRLRGQVKFNTVKDKFCRLSESHFIARCPPVVSSLKGCPQFETSYDPYIMPDFLSLASILYFSTKCFEETTGGSRKRKAESLDGDEGIYWRINWQRFDSYIRDEVTLELLVPKLFDMMRAVKENELGIEKSDLEKTLKILAEESHGVVRKSGESGGGLYIIDFEAAIEQICQFHIESLIREQLEYRAVRIFRLLQQKGHLEEDQIEKLTMISGKETRELLYAMLEEGYVYTKPIGRTNDFAPSRTFVLYHVDLPQTVRSLIEYTCKVEMYLSAADRLALEKYRRAQTVLNAAETECERGLFAFRLFVEFSRRKC
ncbi:unnamed protein product [Angiostrongylus costaricensis]|uniref:DNA-directed RNA polymerase III subunit RPC3 n=1 Tax=Angiostrongylus costaricensis TaxID=334426 RepID=A0A0R3PA21_ANGCS|nr:unnamed protein product [Angiostrongylus costaricensis]